jgi:hypothetical protein
VASEIEVQQQIRLALGRVPGLVLWRNSGGLAERDGRIQRFGLCKGSSDLIGIFSTVIGHEHVGLTFGRFVAGEIKRPSWKSPSDWDTDPQKLFLDLVDARGGLSGVWRSIDDAKKTLGIP